MATLTDQALLAEIVEQDESDIVRLAALQRLTSQSALARIAKSNNPFNARALGGMTDESQIVDVARTAEEPRIRSLAVDRIDDAIILNQIAAFDVDATVRQDARRRRVRLGVDPMRYFLTRVLSGLQVAEAKADRAAEYCGDLDDVCGALVCDRRFRINGILVDRREEAFAARVDSAPSVPAHAGAIDFSPARRCCVELVAAKCGGDGEPTNRTYGRHYYRIKVWRMGEGSFHASVEQRRSERVRNVAVWSASSGGREESFCGGETSIRVD